MRTYNRLWRGSAPLTIASLILSAAFVLSLAGLLLDPRIITGAPAWLKPAKFAISTAIFTGTMAWVFTYVTIWPRFLQAMGWVLALAGLLEVLIIDLQAARGTTSHFNFATQLDATLFLIMAVTIALLLLASIGVLIALLRQKFEDPAWGWALRLGMLITVLGASSAGFMTRPTPPQMQALRSGKPATIIGAHTVGAPDGGPGLTGTGWSREHGDLRVPHFFGLHGIQVVPLFAWLLSKRRRLRVKPVVAFAIGYLGFIAILVWQALRGQALLAPDPLTVSVVSIWLAITLGALVLALRAGNRSHAQSMRPIQVL